MSNEKKTKAQFQVFQKGLDYFLDNEFWADLYNSAPDGAKGWLESEFDASMRLENGEEPPKGEDPNMEKVREKMKKSDWEWLIKFDCRHPKQKEYFKMMAEKASD